MYVHCMLSPTTPRRSVHNPPSPSPAPAPPAPVFVPPRARSVHFLFIFMQRETRCGRRLVVGSFYADHCPCCSCCWYFFFVLVLCCVFCCAVCRRLCAPVLPFSLHFSPIHFSRPPPPLSPVPGCILCRPVALCVSVACSVSSCFSRHRRRCRRRRRR